MNEKEELLEFMKRQITIENEIVSSLDKGVTNIKNPPVKAVLKGISLDSVKHAELYGAAIKLLTETSTALTQENLDEQRALLNDLESCQSPRTCPHGRPTMIHLSVDLLERQFGRRGAR